VGESERRFVLAVARCFVRDLPEDEAARELAAASAEVASWDDVEWLLGKHASATIAYHVLKPATVRSVCGVPAETLAWLRQRYADAFVQVTLEPPLLHRAINALAAAGVSTLAAKGLALGAWLYGDPALREHEDLDLIAPEAMAGTCDEVLRELGYRKASGVLPVPVLPRERLNSVTYLGTGEQPSLDLSFDPLRLFWRAEGDSDPWFDEVWSRRRTVTIGSRSAPTLSLEDDLIYLARHLQFHDFFRVNWYVDLALLLGWHGDRLDWHYVGRTARRLDVHGGVFRALELVDHAFGVDLPGGAWDALRPNPVVRGLHRRIWPERYAVPRPLFSEGGSPLVPRYVGLRGAHPIAAMVLLATQKHRRLHFAYLVRRIVPTKRWLRSAYAAESRSDASHASLLLHHFRHLRNVRERVVTQHQTKQE
jgi:hypothetical protein